MKVWLRDWLKNFMATESAKMQGMTFVEKLQYIWEYYKLQIVIFVVVVVFILTLALNRTQQNYLYAAWLGHPVPQESLTRLGEGLAVIAEDAGGGPVLITSYLVTGDGEIDVALQTRFFAMMQAGFIDIAFVRYDDMLHLASLGGIAPLNNFMAEVRTLNPELYSRLTPRLRTVDFVDLDGVSHTALLGISLEDSPLFAEVGIPSRNMYLSVIFSAENLYRIVAALEVLLP